MDAMLWIILIAALILAVGTVAYFELALRSSPFSQPSPSSPGPREVSSETERKAQPASVNTPVPGQVALMSSPLPRCETGQSQS
ncbi:MAG TPA: hypothetical protein VKU37_13175 [Verrucomicrobiae bacterium]|jgi:hypothetical protein|nr:hypothetical protein [Verrucomicrobiae bacterium]